MFFWNKKGVSPEYMIKDRFEGDVANEVVSEVANETSDDDIEYF